MKYAVVLLTLFPVLCPIGAAAQPAEPVRARYAAYFKGLNIMVLEVQLALTPRTYRFDMAFHTTGLIGALFKSKSTTRVDGSFGPAGPAPRELFSTGQARGVNRVTQLDWRGGNPVVVQLVPPFAEDDREPVTEAEQAGTIDSISAIAQLLRRIADTGRCETTAKTFDGRRLADLAATTVGMETLEATSRSSFSGPALRCDFIGHQRGGFMRDVDRAELTKPQTGSGWFASVRPGEPPIPVRFTFQTRTVGQITAYLADEP